MVETHVSYTESFSRDQEDGDQRTERDLNNSGATDEGNKDHPRHFDLGQ